MNSVKVIILSLLALNLSYNSLASNHNHREKRSKKDNKKVVLDSLARVGIESEEVNRPANQFLLAVYEQLQNGEGVGKTLPVAGIKKKAIDNADTVRSFTAKGVYIVISVIIKVKCIQYFHYLYYFVIYILGCLTTTYQVAW